MSAKLWQCSSGLPTLQMQVVPFRVRLGRALESIKGIWLKVLYREAVQVGLSRSQSGPRSMYVVTATVPQKNTASPPAPRLYITVQALCRRRLRVSGSRLQQHTVCSNVA